MSSAIDQFRSAIAGAGLVPPDEIRDDGLLHRFSTSGKRQDLSGWYCLHSDGVAAGAFGCWGRLRKRKIKHVKQVAAVVAA